MNLLQGGVNRRQVSMSEAAARWRCSVVVGHNLIAYFNGGVNLTMAKGVNLPAGSVMIL